MKMQNLQMTLILLIGFFLSFGSLNSVVAATRDSNPGQFTVFNGMLFFVVDDGINGRQLWETDGTAAGTVMLKKTEIHNNEPIILTNLNNALYFTANYTQYFGSELWKTDGFETGTVKATLYSFGGYLGKVNNAFLYLDYDGALWKSYGTNDPPVEVVPVLWKVYNPFVINNTLFFSSDTPQHQYPDCTMYQGIELWKTDGTNDGTFQIKNINPFPYPDCSTLGDYLYTSSFPRCFYNFNNTLVFIATDTYTPDNNCLNFIFSLWKSDGTEQGTVKLKPTNQLRFSMDYNPYFVNVNGTLFFVGDGGYDSSSCQPQPPTRYQLWKTNGTESGTIMVKQIDPTGQGSPRPQANLNGILLLGANDGINGNELWKSNGTAAGTVMVKDINPSGHSGPNILAVVGNTAFLSATDGVHGIDLWKTDGTAAGTVMVKDINPSGDSSPQNGISFNGMLYFTADDGKNGRELWKSDGTEAGTVMVKNINPWGYKEAVIDGTGGTIDNGYDCSVTIPPGAVNSATNFSITAVDEGSTMPVDGGTVNVITANKLEPSGVTFDPPVTVTLKWTNTGAIDENKLVVVKDGKVITTPCNVTPCVPQTENCLSCSCDPVNNTFTVEVNSFSEFVIGELVEESTIIKLSYFNAIPKSNCIELVWTTESEIDNAGFNIYRSESENGNNTKINPALIPAKGSASQGALYEFVDRNVQNRKTYWYKLEDIDLNGQSTMHGSVKATPRLLSGIMK